MALNRQSLLAVSAVFLGYGVMTELQFACMDVDFAPSFVRTSSPDEPRTFIDGQLGIIEPTYLHTHLFWAYRHLEGVGFTEEQRDQLVPRPMPPPSQEYEPQKSATELWTETVAETGRESKLVQSFLYGGNMRMRQVPFGQWQFYLNCPDDAVLTATRTLKNRMTQFGPKSPEVQEWLDAQETVFDNCKEGAAIPAPAPAHLPALIKADRNYQIAAAHFYAGNFDEAARRFEAIAADASSPWSGWGRYLAGRCFLRKGTLAADFGEVDATTLREAEVRFAAVTEDPNLSHLHDSARGLLEYVRVRLQPDQTMKALSSELVKKEASGIEERWRDYDWLLDRGHGTAIDDDMTDWLRTFQSSDPNALEHALSRWRDKKTLPWLVAVLAKINADHQAVDEVIAAATVPSSSPGYLMAIYHRLRLEVAKGRQESVRAELDELLYEGGGVAMPPSTRNHFQAMRLGLAETFEQFLRASLREQVVGRAPVLGGDDSLKVLVAEDSLVVFNQQLPLQHLIEAAGSAILPLHVREELALAAWVRAALLVEVGQEPAARAIASELWPSLKAELDAYAAAPDGQAKKFALAFFLLRHPGARPYLAATVRRAEPINEIDDFRENWWCRLDWEPAMHMPIYLKRRQQQLEHGGGQGLLNLTFPSFLSSAEITAAERQIRELLTIPTAPNHLSYVVINWAKSHPEDPRVPQALHLAVRSTRVGCTDDHTTALSKAAFQQLHRRYPDSEWAKKTKYWY
ncbi:MAG: hypothetical protein O2968_06105 [Acidobacteria bacterium]|nr:hypothetical protein [Acidobacteriota bacterium]